MTDETVDCFNCGRPNPEWAQVCRTCGVALRHGEAPVVPTGPFPTDQASLISIGAVVATIIAAVLLGLFVSGLNTTGQTVSQASPSPTASVAPPPSPSAAPSASAAAPAAPTGTPPSPSTAPTPPLPGTITFGTELDANRLVATPVEAFSPGATFAYSVQMPDGFGASAIENEIAKITEEGENIVLPRQSVGVDPAATSFGYVIGTAGDFLGPWGPGEFEWRVYVNGEIIARGTFRFSEG